MNYKIREAQMKKIPYMLVLGDKEQNDETVAVRSRKEQNQGVKTIKDFCNIICEEINARTV
jgi:threonyl-tRNA synthetase